MGFPPDHPSVESIRAKMIERHARKRAVTGAPELSEHKRQQRREWNRRYRVKLALGLVGTGRKKTERDPPT